MLVWKGADLTGLAMAVIERATNDACDLDPIAGAWLLSDEAGIYAELAGLEDGVLGELASLVLVRLQNGNN
jgi:hypothetical protein